jgi:hypothetical protein
MAYSSRSSDAAPSEQRPCAPGLPADKSRTGRIGRPPFFTAARETRCFRAPAAHTSPGLFGLPHALLEERGEYHGIPSALRCIRPRRDASGVRLQQSFVVPPRQLGFMLRALLHAVLQPLLRAVRFSLLRPKLRLRAGPGAVPSVRRS